MVRVWWCFKIGTDSRIFHIQLEQNAKGMNEIIYNTCLLLGQSGAGQIEHIKTFSVDL